MTITTKIASPDVPIEVGNSVVDVIGVPKSYVDAQDQSILTSATKLVTDEVARAKAAETLKANQTDLTDEVTRAKAAETLKANQTDLTDEVTRAKAAETALSDKIIQIESNDTWQNLAAAAASGTASTKYSIGDQISEPWVDIKTKTSYDNPWRINHFGDATLENGNTVHGVWLQNVYAHLYGVQFSHPRAFCKCPDGYSAGTFHITFGATFGKATSGKSYQFTVLNDIPAGAKMAGFYYMQDADPSSYKVYIYSADGKTILETVSTVTEGTGGTDLGTMLLAQRNVNLNSMQETAYGWNRYIGSALRQYLNSSAGISEWWTAFDAFDIAPDQLTQIPGFLSGLPDTMKEVILPIKTTTYANTTNDGGGADITYDRVTLPAVEQMYINPQISGEGEAHDYWKQVNGTTTLYAQGGTYPDLIHYAVENHTSAQYVRLRSASRGGACGTWYVGASGNVGPGGNLASNAHRFSPLVFIG